MNRKGKTVNLKLRNKVKKDIFSSSYKRGTRKKESLPFESGSRNSGALILMKARPRYKTKEKNSFIVPGNLVLTTGLKT